MFSYVASGCELGCALKLLARVVLRAHWVVSQNETCCPAGCVKNTQQHLTVACALACVLTYGKDCKYKVFLPTEATHNIRTIKRQCETTHLTALQVLSFDVALCFVEHVKFWTLNINGAFQ